MQGGTKARTGAYEAVREDAGLKFQRRRCPLSTDQGQCDRLDAYGVLWKDTALSLLSAVE